MQTIEGNWKCSAQQWCRESTCVWWKCQTHCGVFVHSLWNLAQDAAHELQMLCWTMHYMLQEHLCLCADNLYIVSQCSALEHKITTGCQVLTETLILCLIGDANTLCLMSIILITQQSIV
jgi:hypothetical protein